MGDNLKAASRFVSRSMSSLDHLMTGSELSQTVIIDQLDGLQRGAKAMRARAIYRATQTAVDMLYKGQPAEKFQSELIVVRALVEQYKSGLDEVLQAQLPTESVSPVQPVAPAVTPVGDMIADLNAQLSADMLQTSKAEIQVDNSRSKQEDVSSLSAARTHLDPLITHAPEAEQRDALRRLSRLHGAAERAASVAAEIVEFETLMPELTNVVLTTARHVGKTVSISYAANDVRIGAGMAKKIQPALIDLCSLLVTRSLETPDVRRERGESGAGHVSIITTLQQGKIMISAECTGNDLEASDFELPSWQGLKAVGGIFELGRDGDRFCLNVTGLPIYLRNNYTRNLSENHTNLEQAS